MLVEVRLSSLEVQVAAGKGLIKRHRAAEDKNGRSDLKQPTVVLRLGVYPRSAWKREKK
jgi:hypothetical protein